jgi:hypothetical protein
MMAYPPTFKVRDGDSSENWVEYIAHDAEQAAELYARDFDFDMDYVFQRDDGFVLEVMLPDKNIIQYRVKGEQSVEYDAKRI